MSKRDDLEAWFFGGIRFYEFVAILLRKTRWTDKWPPITRVVTRHPVSENGTVLGLKYHFVRHRKKRFKD